MREASVKKKISEDYVVRYGYENKTNRTDYDTLPNAKKQFEKLKRDSGVTWAELLHEPLDDEDKQIVIDSFEKPVIEFLGQKIVINIG